MWQWAYPKGMVARIMADLAIVQVFGVLAFFARRSQSFAQVVLLMWFCSFLFWLPYVPRVDDREIRVAIMMKAFFLLYGGMTMTIFHGRVHCFEYHFFGH